MARLQEGDHTSLLHRTQTLLHIPVGWGPHGTAIGQRQYGTATQDMDLIAAALNGDHTTQL